MECFYPVVKNLSSSLLFSGNVKVKCRIKLIFHLILCLYESLSCILTEEHTGGAEGNISA